MQQRITWMFGIIFLLFLLLICWQSYWQINRSDWLLALPSNRRMARVEYATPRGTIYDRNGLKLAWSENGKRKYADPVALSAVVGYIDPRYGRIGVEGLWDAELAGLSQRFSAKDLQRMVAGEKPRGKDLQLTLDLRLQQAALKALGNKRGAIVMLDPQTGGILALATYPTFNAETFGEDFEELSNRDDGVLRNRATQNSYPPGSTMKVVTAAAALHSGVPSSTSYTCIGRTKLRNTTVRDYQGSSHGEIAMPAALTKSCNAYFAATALALGQRNLYSTAEAFGFGQPWWEKLPQQPPILPLKVSESSLTPDISRLVPDGELAQMGFGQATVVATPLQMAMVCATVFNGGTSYAPYLVSELRKGDSAYSYAKYHSRAIGYPLQVSEATELAGMMRMVVTSGTGRAANNIPGLVISGKTGTAQQRGGNDHAWFIGFATADKSRPVTSSVAFAVLIERGGTGGRVAVPVAVEALKAWLATGH